MKKEFINHFFRIALDEMYHGADHNQWLKIINECFDHCQPERSKREDSCCTRYYVEYSPGFGIPNGYEYLKSDGMRCSEHSGN